MSSISTKTLSRIRTQFETLWQMPGPQSNAQNCSVKDLKVGSFFTLRQHTYRVTQIHRYQEGSDWEWWELVIYCLNTGEVTFLEWEFDDELEVCLTTESDVSLSKLGIAGSRIKALVDEEGSIRYGGQVYEYEDDAKVKFFKDNQGEGTKLWMIDYEAEDEEHFLTLERWKQEDGTKDWEAHLSVFVDPREIEVIHI